MMPLKIKNLKYIIKNVSEYAVFFILAFAPVNSQEIIEENTKDDFIEKAVDSISLVKVDGVAAVVGDFVILESDIDKQFAQLEASGISTKDITRCQLFGKLMEDNLQHPTASPLTKPLVALLAFHRT